MAEILPDKNSQWYPYFNVQENYYDLSGTEKIPKQICDYIIDAPNPQTGYTPQDNNSYARARLWKYLYYDNPEPLSETLPTINEKLSVLFNPEMPENPPTDKGYRLFPLIYVKQSQEAAQTRLFVYMGRTVPSNDELKITVSVVFYVWTHYGYENNTKTDAYSRAFAIEQAIIEAFHGVNMAGIGTFSFSKAKHPDCGSRAIFDGNTNVGREITMALEIATNKRNTDLNTFNMPPFNGNENIRIG